MQVSAVSSLLDWSQVMERNPLATIVIDTQHRIVLWNHACAVLTGLPAAEMLGTDRHWSAFYDTPCAILLDFIVDGIALENEPRYRDRVRPSALIAGACEVEDFVARFAPNGRWIFATAAAIRNGDGEIIGAIETLQDVTERHRAETALRDSEACLSQIVGGSSVATFVIDAEHRVTHWNHACEVITGKLARDVIGTSDQWQVFYPVQRPVMADLILDGAAGGKLDLHYHGIHRPSMLVQGAYEAEDFFPHFGDGGRWLFFTAAPLRNAAGKVIGAIETLQDVTERRRAEEALRQSEERYRRLSQTDSLTGLFNSRYLQEQLHLELERAERYDRPLSLLVLDCDKFKRINDTFGHLEGDKVLQALAQVIGSCLRSSDSAYRYGGEEFIVLLPETAIDAGAVIGERLRTGFAEVEIPASNGVPMRCTVSIGVAEYWPGDSELSLVRRADEACYRAKRQGRNCVVSAARRTVPQPAAGASPAG